MAKADLRRDVTVYSPHTVPKIIYYLNLGINTEPVMAEADATVFVRLLITYCVYIVQYNVHTVYQPRNQTLSVAYAYAPVVTDSVFMPRFRSFLGQFTVLLYQYIYIL